MMDIAVICFQLVIQHVSAVLELVVITVLTASRAIIAMNLITALVGAFLVYYIRQRSVEKWKLKLKISKT